MHLSIQLRRRIRICIIMIRWIEQQWIIHHSWSVWIWIWHRMLHQYSQTTWAHNPRSPHRSPSLQCTRPSKTPYHFYQTQLAVIKTGWQTAPWIILSIRRIIGNSCPSAPSQQVSSTQPCTPAAIHASEPTTVPRAAKNERKWKIRCSRLCSIIERTRHRNRECIESGRRVKQLMRRSWRTATLT